MLSPQRVKKESNMTNKQCSIDIFNECVPYFEMLKDTQHQEIVINLIKQKELSVSELV